MSQEQKDKKGFLERPTSRREFLKLSCKGLAGAAVSVSILSLFTNSTEASGMALAEGIIISDPNRCTGCRRCETTCTIRNDGKAHPYISRVKVTRNLNYGPKGPSTAYWQGEGNLGNFKIIPDTCKQCADPACANACPIGAISADPKTGARVVDRNTCAGCGACSRACPWHMATVDPVEKVSTKCVLCEGAPSCVAGCPTGALRFVPWNEVTRVMRKHRLA